MRIIGAWLLCDDGAISPTLRAKSLREDGTLAADVFLLDTGADRTVFSAAFLEDLGLPAHDSSPEYSLVGISGNRPFVLVETALEFSHDDGGVVRVRGEFAAFSDPTATDMSVLGRDVLNNFDVILSRRRNEVLLLAPNHQYRVEKS